MSPRRYHHRTKQTAGTGRFVYIATVAAFALIASAPRALAQAHCPSAPCGDGSDGAYNPTTSGYFTPSQFHGGGVANNVFNFTSVTIPAGVTITLTTGYDNAPVYWLATQNVDIEGTLSLSGANGANPSSDVDFRLPALAGSGGYNGGVGGDPITNQPPTSGGGPGGGAAGANTCGGVPGVGGTWTGNQYLIPLVGGSGGGGGGSDGGGGHGYGAGGGAGGGAILIASSTQITVNGTIAANGGAGNQVGFCSTSGGGSGGAIRLVSNTITGTGTVTGLGGGFPGNTGTNSRARLEAYTISFTGSFNGTPVDESTPLSNFSQFIPTVPQPSVQVTSINGQAITENPFTFPDITINTDQPVPVVITGHQVPIGTVPTLVILGESADQALTCAGGLQGTLATSTCTINITYAFGGSRGLVRTTWQNPGSNVPH